MFVSKRKWKRLNITVERLERDSARLQSHRDKTNANLTSVHEDIRGKFNIYTKTCSMGLASQVAYLTKKVQTHADNLGMIMDFLGIEFIDLDAKRIVRNKYDK